MYRARGNNMKFWRTWFSEDDLAVFVCQSQQYQEKSYNNKRFSRKN